MWWSLWLARWSLWILLVFWKLVWCRKVHPTRSSCFRLADSHGICCSPNVLIRFEANRVFLVLLFWGVWHVQLVVLIICTDLFSLLSWTGSGYNISCVDPFLLVVYVSFEITISIVKNLTGALVIQQLDADLHLIIKCMRFSVAVLLDHGAWFMKQWWRTVVVLAKVDKYFSLYT